MNEALKTIDALPDGFIRYIEFGKEPNSGFQTLDPEIPIADLKKLAASVPKWTRVEDGLPEKDGNYICTMQRSDGSRYTYPKFYEVGTDMWIDLSRNSVIVWMPLPEPFTEDTDEQR